MLNHAGQHKIPKCMLSELSKSAESSKKILANLPEMEALCQHGRNSRNARAAKGDVSNGTKSRHKDSPLAVLYIETGLKLPADFRDQRHALAHAL